MKLGTVVILSGEAAETYMRLVSTLPQLAKQAVSASTKLKHVADALTALGQDSQKGEHKK